MSVDSALQVFEGERHSSFIMKRIALHSTASILAFIVGIFAVNVSVSLRRTLCAPVIPVKHPSILRPANTVQRQDEIPDLGDNSKLVSYTHRYSNYEYAYTVSIPAGFTGIGPAAPFPQHGIGITLSKRPKSYVWLDGSYNSLEWESLEQATDKHLKWLADDRNELILLKRQSINLQNLAAMRLVVRYKSLATNEIRIQDIVIAFRSYGGERLGLTYSLGLIAPAVRYDEDVKTFEQIIAKWRQRKLPRAHNKRRERTCH